MSDYSPQLKEIASKKDKLVIFAGNGVTSATGIPTWGKLLIELENKLGLSGILTKKNANELIDSIDYSSEAQKLYDAICRKEKEKGKEKFNKSLNSLLDTCHWDYGPSQLNIIHVCKRIVTTNFDNTFEEANRDYYFFKNETPKPFEIKQLPNILPTDIFKEYCLIYLHGRRETDGYQLIFKENDYRKFYAKNNLNEIECNKLKDFYKLLFMSNTVLFVGFSFDDFYFLKTIELIRDEIKKDDAVGLDVSSKYSPNFSSQNHYTFLYNKEKKFRDEIKSQENEKAKLFPSDSKYDKINDTIKELENKISNFNNLQERLKQLHIMPLIYNDHKEYRKWLAEIIEIPESSMSVQKAVDKWSPNDA